jgi:hypothetical protein
MKTRLVLRPGQRGTKRLVEKYGAALVCVRFRYDAESCQRLKTVELIIERTDWTPPPARHAPESLVPLRISASDLPLRAMVKAAGGRWNPDEQLWFVRYGNIAGTQLERHIPVDANRTGKTD